MAAAAADLEAHPRTPSAAGAVTVQPRPFPAAPEREARAVRRTTPVGTWALRIAAVLVIGVLGAWNVLLQGQLDQSRTYEQNVAAVLDAAGEPGSLTAILTAEGGGPAGLAAVSSDGAVRLAMRDLAPTQGEQVYTTWVIGAGPEPVRVGDFRVDASGTAYFEGTAPSTQDGIVLALTLEPGPGATAPSSTPVSLGTAAGEG